MINLKVILYSIVTAMICLSLYLSYSYIKNIGYREAEEVYKAKILEYEKSVTKKVESIEELSRTLLDENRTYAASISSDINAILRKPTGSYTIIKDGKCQPTAAVGDTIKSINLQVNQGLDKK